MLRLARARSASSAAKRDLHPRPVRAGLDRVLDRLRVRRAARARTRTRSRRRCPPAASRCGGRTSPGWRRPARPARWSGVCSCTAHSWLDASLTVKRIASVNGCPVTGIGFASAALALSPVILNAAIPAPPSRSTRGRAGDARVGGLLHRVRLVVGGGWPAAVGRRSPAGADRGRRRRRALDASAGDRGTRHETSKGQSQMSQPEHARESSRFGRRRAPNVAFSPQESMIMRAVFSSMGPGSRARCWPLPPRVRRQLRGHGDGAGARLPGVGPGVERRSSGRGLPQLRSGGAQPRDAASRRA